MPVHQYVVLSDKRPQEVIEIEQGVDDAPLAKHPITKEPIRKVLSSPTLSLKHSDVNEKKSLSEENLNKHGFSVYHKDSTDGTYHKKSGKGPDSINP